MRTPLLFCLLVPLVSRVHGQSLEAIVREAVESSFKMPRNMRKALIPAVVKEKIPYHHRSRGAMAINALNRFSQNNAPEMNKMLDTRSRMASEAALKIARSRPVLARAPNNRAPQMVASDPIISQSFRRAMSPVCYEIPVCDPQDPYRSADGSCNNLFNPILGKAFTPQSRILPNAYDNSIDLPRTRSSNNRDPLPSARLVSNVILSGSNPVSSVFTTFLTHFGQFIDHDIISTPSMTEGDPPNAVVDCCAPNVNKYACFPIQVPDGDGEYPGKTCMNMVRHAAAIPLDCDNGVREQQNQRSSFIDGTALYGFNRERELLLRELRGGRLKESDRIQGLLPRFGCPAGISTPFHCFVAGDHRQSETPTLTVVHIAWLRRHNLIADALRTATNVTDDETLFQEAKRIVVAELQHVTYREFLPAVLNYRFMRVFNLRSRFSGHSNDYNPSVDPRTFNSFGAAVLRMGHTMVRNEVGHDDGRGRVQSFNLKDHFEDPNLMFSPPYGFEHMARWMAKNGKSQGDHAFVDGLRNKLFEGPAGPFPAETVAFDLGALNIQRGREHGLPPYNAYREFCGLRPAAHFSNRLGGLVDHSRTNAAKLARVYRTTDDIDLFAGGMSETPVWGGILGPTFSCLLAYQFSLYKHGDRFWYENNDHENPLAAFTTEQLANLKQITHSKILCSVLKDDKGSLNYQPRLFEHPDNYRNEPRPCAQILNGSPIGYNFKPFVEQLASLNGSRRGRRRPALGSIASFRRVSASQSSQSSQTRRAPNVGFKIPNPKDVVENIVKLSATDNNNRPRATIRNSPVRRTNRIQSQSTQRAFWQRN